MQKLIDLYNRGRTFLKAILTKNDLDEKWIKLFPTLDKGQLRCYLSQICM
jgi:hypothetical protein